LFPQAKQLLQERGFVLLASYAVKKPKLLNETLTTALSHQPDLLVIGSGDGTVSEAVDHLAFADVALGFIPLGTTNNFARSAGIPLDLAGAIDTITDGVVDDIDLGVVTKPESDHKDYFANVASIGLSVEVAARVPHALKRRIGRAAYALTGLRTLISHRAFKARITADGKEHRISTHQMVIANGRSHGGRVIARDVDIDNKQLTIFRLGRRGRWQLIKATLRFSLQQNRSTREKDYLTTTEATIRTDPVCSVEIDGEIKTTTPATFSVAPDALYLMVPDSVDKNR
jgi:YegS/Rv2252/BmrU family lipid kinase